MTMTDPLGDMLTRIRNAQGRRKATVVTPASTLRKSVLDVLADEGFIRGYNIQGEDQPQGEFLIELKYYEGEPVIRQISRISKPGRRVYTSVRDMPRIQNGLGVAILSTPKGVMTDTKARTENVGGEVLCQVF